MKKLYYFAALAAAFTMPLFGDGEEKKIKPVSAKKEPPFDADLFKRNVQCYSLRGEFLYWRVQEGALDYANKMNSNAWGPNSCYAEGKYKSATFNGDPGFRATLTYFRAPHYWEMWAQYTRLTSRGSDHAGKPSSSEHYLTGTWPQIFTNPMASANSYIHLNYNLADLLLTRVFFPNPHLKLRFVGGGVVSWMNQFWKIVYADSASFQTKIANRWRFIGGGLRVGTTFDWYWFTDVYMTGGASFACLLGSYQNSVVGTTNYQPSSSYNTALPFLKTNFRDIRPALQSVFYLGPSYQKNLTHQRLEVFMGYEISTWLNVQEVYRSIGGTPTQEKLTINNSSMLALQGLTARVTVDF